MNTNPELDGFFDKEARWPEVMRELRRICLTEDLEEVRRWRQPCYAAFGGNIAIIGGFKEYCVLSFFKGVLVEDPKGLLEAHTENMQSARHVRFTSADEVRRREPDLRGLIVAAMRVEEQGLKVEFKKTEAFDVPEELTAAFAADAGFKDAFDALTPGRQRGYLLHFAGAKQSKTREARIAKHRARIFDGKGLQDR